MFSQRISILKLVGCYLIKHALALIIFYGVIRKVIFFSSVKSFSILNESFFFLNWNLLLLCFFFAKRLSEI